MAIYPHFEGENHLHLKVSSRLEQVEHFGVRNVAKSVFTSSTRSRSAVYEETTLLISHCRSNTHMIVSNRVLRHNWERSCVDMSKLSR